MSITKDQRETINNFFQEELPKVRDKEDYNSPNNKGHYIFIPRLNGEIVQYLSQACHSWFNPQSQLRYFGTSFLPRTGDENLAWMLWDEWMGNRNRSPWRILLPFITFHSNEEIPLGWSLEEGVNGWSFKDPPVGLDFIKNFAIACRGLSEVPAKYRVWRIFIEDFGLGFNEAYYLSTFISPEFDVKRDYNLKKVVSNMHIGGQHWPIQDENAMDRSSSLDWEKFTNGNVKSVGVANPRINKYFLKIKPRRYFAFLSNTKRVEQNVKEGKFSPYRYPSFTLAELVKEFKSWKKEMGIEKYA